MLRASTMCPSTSNLSLLPSLLGASCGCFPVMSLLNAHRGVLMLLSSLNGCVHVLRLLRLLQFSDQQAAQFRHRSIIAAASIAAAITTRIYHLACATNNDAMRRQGSVSQYTDPHGTLMPHGSPHGSPAGCRPHGSQARVASSPPTTRTWLRGDPPSIPHLCSTSAL